MSMYDRVELTPEEYSEGEALSEMFGAGSMDAAFEERDIDVITEEINFYKQQAGIAILEIGKRLVEAKAQLSHGEWLPWLEKKVEFSERSAQQYIRLWKEYGKSATVADLGVRKALVLLALPESEREEFAGETHEVNGEEKTVSDMTVKELEKAIAERNAAREEAALAKMDLDTARHQVDELTAQLHELRSRPTEVAVQQVDATEEQLASAREEARAAAEAALADREKKLQTDLDRAKKALEKALGDRKAAETRAADAERERDGAMEAAQSFKAEAEAAHKRAAAAADEGMAKFKVVFDQTVANVNTLAELLRGLTDSQQEKLRRAMLALADQVRKVGA